MPSARKPFNLQLTHTQRKELEALHAATGLTMGQVTRDAIHRAYMHIVCNVPTCANGSTCFVPQMHPPRPHTLSSSDAPNTHPIA